MNLLLTWEYIWASLYQKMFILEDEKALEI